MHEAHPLPPRSPPPCLLALEGKMKHKTSELTGALLDAAVALAEGLSPKLVDEGELACFCLIPDPPGMMHCFAPEPRRYYPSQGWMHGGPIIEREHIDLQGRCGAPHRDRIAPEWCARMVSGYFYGDTPLIAAMRAYVASKLGDEVELP
jgi:hypothetical protein